MLIFNHKSKDMAPYLVYTNENEFILEPEDILNKADIDHIHDASDITSGQFDAARIPDLDAAKITSGQFDAARIPDLDAAKITSGTLGTARIPDLNASKIASGTLESARLPIAGTDDIGAVKVDNSPGVANPLHVSATGELYYDYSVIGLRKIQAGNVASAAIGELAAGTHIDVQVSFDETFASTPFVFAMVVTSSNGTDAGMLLATAFNASTTGFTMRVYNSGSSAKSPTVRWFAIEIETV